MADCLQRKQCLRGGYVPFRYLEHAGVVSGAVVCACVGTYMRIQSASTYRNTEMVVALHTLVPTRGEHAHPRIRAHITAHHNRRKLVQASAFDIDVETYWTELVLDLNSE